MEPSTAAAYTSGAGMRSPPHRRAAAFSFFDPDLPGVISRLAHIRHHSPALRYGNYRPLVVKSQQLAFARQTPEECIVVAVNAEDKPVPLELPVPGPGKKQLIDLLNQGDHFPVHGRKALIPAINPCWARIMTVK